MVPPNTVTPGTSRGDTEGMLTKKLEPKWCAGSSHFISNLLFLHLIFGIFMGELFLSNVFNRDQHLYSSARLFTTYCSGHVT